jgi:hypothetical protein
MKSTTVSDERERAKVLLLERLGQLATMRLTAIKTMRDKLDALDPMADDAIAPASITAELDEFQNAHNLSRVNDVG